MPPAGTLEYLSAAEAALEVASHLESEPIAWRQKGRAVAVDCTPPPHAVVAIRWEIA